MCARADLEGNAFQVEPIADARAPELLLLEPFFDEPISQRTWGDDRGTGQRGDFDRISHVVVVCIRYQDEIRALQAFQLHGPIGVGKPRSWPKRRFPAA